MADNTHTSFESPSNINAPTSGVQGSRDIDSESKPTGQPRTFVNLGLSLHPLRNIRNRPENLFLLSIVPGPREPNQLNEYIQGTGTGIAHSRSRFKPDFITTLSRIVGKTIVPDPRIPGSGYESRTSLDTGGIQPLGPYHEAEILDPFFQSTAARLIPLRRLRLRQDDQLIGCEHDFDQACVQGLSPVFFFGVLIIEELAWLSDAGREILTRDMNKKQDEYSGPGVDLLPNPLPTLEALYSVEAGSKISVWLYCEKATSASYMAGRYTIRHLILESRQYCTTEGFSIAFVEESDKSVSPNVIREEIHQIFAAHSCWLLAFYVLQPKYTCPIDIKAWCDFVAGLQDFNTVETVESVAELAGKTLKSLNPAVDWVKHLIAAMEDHN
ncbi:hypothetical protein C8R43DRAFT_957648 [Mycena crocata]|nr:hypothetical protein C8R43DRAFT_957648 [Mycena crocata]